MQEIESAVRDLGGSAMQGIDHAVKGLNSGTLEGTLPFIIGVLILVIVVKCFSLPFQFHVTLHQSAVRMPLFLPWLLPVPVLWLTPLQFHGQGTGHFHQSPQPYR